MSRIRYDEWGSFDTGAGFQFRVPAMAACGKWQDDLAEDTDQRYRVRAWSETAADSSALKISLVGDPAQETVLNPAIGSPAWSSTYGATTNPHPSLSDPTTSAHPKQSFIPMYTLGVFFGYLSAYCSSSGSFSVWGFEISSIHDDGFFDDDMELSDYSDGSIYSDDRPASSWVIKRLGAVAYNKITYEASFLIAFPIKWGQ